MSSDGMDEDPVQPTEAPEPAWAKTKSGKRILELNQVEENIARLLHFAGCTLASLHPDNLESFTTRSIELEEDSSDDDDEEGASPKPPKRKEPTDLTPQEAKAAQFGKHAEAYYITLNDIQISLRTSIRHLRMERASPAPLLDPSFASVANPGGGGIGVGGVALGSSTVRSDGEGVEGKQPRLSVAAMTLEKEAWEDLVKALGTTGLSSE